MTPPKGVTQLLAEYRDGSKDALEELMPLVYGELRRIAAHHFRRERLDHTLQPTALVNEAYVRLANQADFRPGDRSHFFGIAARLMRQILVDHARGHGRAKRGGDVARVTLDEHAREGPAQDVDLIVLNDALDALAAADARLVELVELRYFGGLSIEETAEALNVSPATVKRDWAVAKAFLRRTMETGQPR